MADKPSRGLVLYGDGLARFINPSHTHLHDLASRGSCGFLSLSNSPPSETEDERIVREFAQLLDSCEASLGVNVGGATNLECQQKSLMPTISERFMGMRAAIVANNSSLTSFGGTLGFTVMQTDELIKSNHPLSEPPVDVVASESLKLLGFQEGKTLETSQFDLIFMHIGAGEKANGQTEIIANDVEYINGLVGRIMQTAEPGSEIGSRLHLSLVMSYGAISKDDDPSLSVLVTKNENNSDLSSLFPRQSYTMKGGNPRDNISMEEILQYRQTGFCMR
ncbi:uncharacterized protein LOC117913696 isoform X3 [Vitis riparia]|uniref:uncharacterized protein LOC117913696 isoform X3 n=1 Tax=Vitis riparia TaxID=96939 RepID=UPI00155A22E8|nr:uncharacterized protein LOC117913696 isoform X3 [Vitis riparia]